MFRSHLLALLGASLALSCTNSEFASGNASGTKKPSKQTPEPTDDLDTDISTDDPDDGDLDQGSAKKDESELEEDGAEKSIPGVRVTKVGVNFEDVPVGGDADYNDAVMCFTGKFKVENSQVVSTADQTVIATTFSSSGCKHNVRAEVVHKDGSKEPPVTFDSRAPQPVTLQFKIGATLEVYMKPYDGCNEGFERNMHSAQDAQVKPDVCNDK